jgi:two-component system, NarL family, sensor histidine kinase UhpB
VGYSGRGMRGAIARARALPLVWQIFIPSAAILAVACVALLVTPATVSNPVALEEAAIVVAGLAVVIAINMLLIRRSVRPISELVAVMREVDLLLPGQRVPLEKGSAETNELCASFNGMLDRLESERRESNRRALLAQEDERRRLARGLHDELNQSIAAVMLRLRAIARENDGRVATELESVQGELRALTVEVDNIVNSLRPETLDELGLLSALMVLTDQFAELGDVQVEREIADRLPPLAPESELAIYRVAQESLTNIAAHAGASRAVIRLVTAENGRVHLTVSDDGVGMDQAAEGNGIRGMRERALLVEGELTISSAVPNTGTEVNLSVPSRAS